MSSPKPDQQRKRLRRPLRQRQRLGFGERQRTVRPLDPAPWRAGVAAQRLPVQHPGPADLVRGAGHRGRPSRRARRRRHDGGDEPADLGQGSRLDRARRLSVLRLDQADAVVEIPRRHHRDRRAADRHHQFDLYRSAPAPAVQEHHLSRRAVRPARHGPEAGRAADRRAVQGQGKAAVVERPRAASRPRLGAAEPQMPDRPAGQEGRQGRRPHFHRRQQRRRARRGLWRRHRVRLVSDHAVVVAGRRLRQPLQEAAARSRKPARPNTPSSRARTNWPRSAS